MPRFFLQSVGLHAIFFLLTSFIHVVPENPAPPIKIIMLDAGQLPNNDLPEGLILETPKPKKEEAPSEAKILSRHDRKAKSPEKGKEYKAGKTAVPRKSVNPQAPSKKKTKENTPAQSPDKPKIKIAALSKTDANKNEESVSKEMNVFSRDVAQKPEEAEQAKIFEKNEKEKEEKRRTLSALMTDRPDPDSKELSHVVGMPDLEGADIESFAMTDTDNVVDMGDEAIVSLNTKSFKYMDYFVSIKEAMETMWAYPEEAIIQGLSGRTMLRFTLAKDGELEGVQVLKSSGHKSLDDEAQLAIKAAAPYEKFPHTLQKKRLHIIATFVYQPTFNAVK